MVFKCTINGWIVSCPLPYGGKFKCKELVKKSNLALVALVDLYTMEICIANAEMHKETILNEICAKI